MAVRSVLLWLPLVFVFQTLFDVLAAAGVKVDSLAFDEQFTSFVPQCFVVPLWNEVFLDGPWLKQVLETVFDLMALLGQ